MLTHRQRLMAALENVVVWAPAQSLGASTYDRPCCHTMDVCETYRFDCDELRSTQAWIAPVVHEHGPTGRWCRPATGLLASAWNAHHSDHQH